jgi:hypothetical protein
MRVLQWQKARRSIKEKMETLTPLKTEHGITVAVGDEDDVSTA